MLSRAITAHKTLVIVSRVTDPHWNLACGALIHADMAKRTNLERLLFLCRSPSITGAILLGRHSNQAMEACTQQAHREQVPIARRPSGGDTHYVAPGNVLFSAMSRMSLQKPQRAFPHNPWITAALMACGVNARECDKEGRNICVGTDNNKVVHSVQEVSLDGQTLQQHGVVVSCTDDACARRLLLQDVKRCRAPLGLEPEQMEDAMATAFDSQATRIECHTAADVWDSPADRRRLGILHQHLSSAEFVYNGNPEFEWVLKQTFAFGDIEMHLEVDTRDTVLRARIFSNTTDTLFIERLEDALVRRNMRNAAVLARGVHDYFHLPILLQNPHAAQQHRALVEPIVAWLASGAGGVFSSLAK